MSPLRLFEYLCAIGGGVFVIGVCVFLVVLMFLVVFGWARRPAVSADGP